MKTTWQQLSHEISENVKSAGRSVVAVDARGGHTSAGIVWRADLILTASHTIGRNGSIAVIAEPGKTVAARLLGQAPGAGLALLRLDQPIAATPADFAVQESLAVGEFVVAIARTRRGNLVASAGVLSGLMGEWQPGRIRIDQFIRPDLTLYPGFSGGALIGADGKILGMNTGGLIRGKPITIPASTLVCVGEELLAKGHIATPYIGVVMQPVSIPESLKQKSGAQVPGGLLVMHVEAAGPAEAGGMFPSDILIDLDGNACDDLDNLHDVLRQRGVGQHIRIGIIRGGQKAELTVRIGERPLR